MSYSDKVRSLELVLDRVQKTADIEGVEFSDEEVLVIQFFISHRVHSELFCRMAFHAHSNDAAIARSELAQANEKATKDGYELVKKLAERFAISSERFEFLFSYVYDRDSCDFGLSFSHNERDKKEAERDADDSSAAGKVEVVRDDKA